MVPEIWFDAETLCPLEDAMVKKPSPETGYRRIVAAFAYSINGLKLACKSEAAFRQELILFSPCQMLLSQSSFWQAVSF